MADHTGIEWAEATWNPIVGCSVVSPGCTNCYAMKMAGRLDAMARADHANPDPQGTPAAHYRGTVRGSKAGAVWSGKLALAPDRILTQPLRWRRPRRIFVNSMGDIFHEETPEAWIDQVFAVMALAPQHTFMVLTKRSARMRAYLSDPDTHHRICVAACEMAMELNLNVTLLAHPSFEPHAPPGPRAHLYRWPLPNVWLGVSAEDQTRANERVPDLLATPAAIRFVSAEPLLGPIDLTRVGNLTTVRAAMPSIVVREERGRPATGHGSVSGFQVEAVGSPHSSIEYFQTPDHMGGFSAASPRRFARLDLVIAGGESGPRARPMHPDWARSLRDQCAAAGTAFFFKQWGEWLPFTQSGFTAWSAANRTVAAQLRKWLGHAHFNDGAGGPETHKTGPLRTDYVLSPGQHAGHLCVAIGKRAAGRLLDGVEHNALPEVRT